MEEHVNQAGNSSTDGLVFTDASIILRALVLGLLILVTVVGNLFVIAAILLERNLQSVANYLIVSLAVADLMVACLVMPLGAVYEINSGWSLGPELCDMWTSSDVLCCTASILHLVAIAVDRYWAVTDLNYIQARNPRRIGMLIVTVWVVSLGISLAPQLGWKDPDYLDRIAAGTCLVSQDPAYQIFATCATFYLPLLVILFLYWRIFQAARKRIRKRPGTIVQPPRERRGILRLVTRRFRFSASLNRYARFYARLVNLPFIHVLRENDAPQTSTLITSLNCSAYLTAFPSTILLHYIHTYFNHILNGARCNFFSCL